MWFLFLVLFMWWIMFIDLHMLNEPALHLWNKAYWIVMDKLSDVLLQSVYSILLKIFASNVHHGYWPEVFFFVESLPGFGIRRMFVS